jgi:DNA mismatch repair protein MutS2
MKERKEGSLIEKLFEFSELDQFLQNYSPMSPYGKIDKNEKKFFTEPDQLNLNFDLIENMINFVKNHSHKSDKIEYHLSRIPQLSMSLNNGNIRSELFNVKKFLHNYKEISLLLDSERSTLFSFEFQSDSLLKFLGHEVNQEETFYLNDSYSQELKDIRKHLHEIDLKLSDIKETRIEKIRQNLGLDFRFHDFLVINESELSSGQDVDSIIYIEPYDNSSVLVKPVFGQEYFHIHNSRKELLEQERLCERGILELLKKNIEAEQTTLETYINNVKSIDTILAKARMAIQFHCVRPVLALNDNIQFEELVYVPLQLKCLENNRKYASLSVSFDNRNIVVTGSNMGGKTVLLKSIAFCQLLVQYGFFVPAKGISTTLFNSLNLIGNINDESLNGLSSFGVEIMNMNDADLSGRTLFIVDEFARTTNSVEAYGLNSALLQWFSERKSVYSFSSTHQDNLPGLPNISYWTMKGLDYEKYSRYYHKDFSGDLNERINLINDYMDYGVEPQKESDIRKDALKIADILGLDSEIITNAKKYINKQEKNNG